MVDDVPDTVFVGVPLTVPETVCVCVGESDAVLDFVAVADSMVEIINLITTERDEGQSDPGQFERRREELNNRLGQIDSRSDRIRVWSSAQCGIELE